MHPFLCLEQLSGCNSSPTKTVSVPGCLLSQVTAPCCQHLPPHNNAGAATRDLLQQSAEQQGQLADSVMRRLQDLGTALRRDVNGGWPACPLAWPCLPNHLLNTHTHLQFTYTPAGALQAAGGEELRSLSRIEAQLAVRLQLLGLRELIVTGSADT